MQTITMADVAETNETPAITINHNVVKTIPVMNGRN